MNAKRVEECANESGTHCSSLDAVTPTCARVMATFGTEDSAMTSQTEGSAFRNGLRSQSPTDKAPSIDNVPLSTADSPPGNTVVAKARWSFLSKNFIRRKSCTPARPGAIPSSVGKSTGNRRHSIAVLAPKASPTPPGIDADTRPVSMDDLSLDRHLPHGSDIFKAVMKDFQDELRASKGSGQGKTQSENIARRRVRWRDDV